MGPSLVFGLGYGLGAPETTRRGHQGIPFVFFLPTEEKFVEMDVGLGEELLLMSRHIGHQGITRNSPILHSGMLSLSPPEYLYNKELDDDELSFLVEARSWGGFKGGSPVLACTPVPIR